MSTTGSNNGSETDVPSCDVPVFVDKYRSLPPFSNTPPIEIAHTGIPRFGFPNDIMLLITGTEQDQQDYVKGIVISSVVVACFFLVWVVALCVLKGMGRKRVGWLSGQRKALLPRPKEGGVPAQGEAKAGQQLEEEEDGEFDGGDGGGTDGKDDDGFADAAMPDGDLPNRPSTDPEWDGTPTDREGWGDQVEPVPPPPAQSNPQDPSVVDDTKDDNGDGTDDIKGGGTDDGAVPVPVPDPPSHTDESWQDNPPLAAATSATPHAMTAEEWEVMYKKKMCEQRWMKMVVFVACVTVISMAILMAVRGIRNLKGSVSYSQSSLGYAEDLIEQGATVVDNLAGFLTDLHDDAENLVEQANTICPNGRPEGICTDLTDPATCNETAIFANNTMQKLITAVSSDWDEDVVNRLDRLSSDLREKAETAQWASNTITTFQWVFYVALAFAIVLAVLALCMILALFLPLPWILRCLQNRCLLPIFLGCTALSFIFAITFLICTLVLGDT
jgi:hypothetical protein